MNRNICKKKKVTLLYIQAFGTEQSYYDTF